MLLGKLLEVHQSLDRAERAYKKLRSAGRGLASVALVRAGVLYQQQRLDEAAVVAQRAEHGFAHIGDEEGRISALYLRASIKFESQQLDKAAILFEQVIAMGRRLRTADGLRVVRQHSAICGVARSDLTNASMHLHVALGYFRASRQTCDVPRVGQLFE